MKEGAFYAARRKSAPEKSSFGTVETSKEEHGNSLTRVSEDSLIAERVKLIVQKLYVTLGIVDGCYPTTA